MVECIDIKKDESIKEEKGNSNTFYCEVCAKTIGEKEIYFWNGVEMCIDCFKRNAPALEKVRVLGTI